MTRVLIDSDVYLDFVLQRTPFHLDANEIFDLIGDGVIEAFVCAFTPVSVFYFTRKAKDIQSAYLAINDLLSTAKICAVDSDVLTNATNLRFSDYEDAVQCASAVAEGLDAIVTRNTKDYQNSPIQIVSPREFLKALPHESAG
ncbi:MAG: PIN domain-containing protein [Pyrinomonadaceae bacterium]